MKFAELEQHLSTPRINRYLTICGTKTRAQKLYLANLKLSQAFHPLLGVIEVALRNNVNTALANHFGDPDWIINQQGGFMGSPTLGATRYYLRTEVQKTIRKLNQRGLAVTSGKVVSEQTFGFWTDLFEPHHFRLIGASSMNAFGNLPAGQNRHGVAATLTEIRKFRNRINHNEPIVLHGNAIDLTKATDAHVSVIDVLNWVDPRLAIWAAKLDTVPTVIARCRNI